VIFPSPKQDQTITLPAIADRTFGDASVPLAAAAGSRLPVSFSIVAGPASVSNNVLSLLGAGTVTVQASQSGNDFFNPAPPVDVSFNVAKADQAIAFGAVPDKSAGDPAFALNATASSGLPVYFDIVSGPAVLDTNAVTLLGGGVVTVSAWQPGNSNFNAAATVQRSFNVAKLAQTISFGALSRQTAGDAPFPLSANASSELPVSFAVVSGPAELSWNIVTLTGAGTVVMRASQTGNAMYAPAANVDQAFDVAPPNHTLANPQRLSDGSFQMVFLVDHLKTADDLKNWIEVYEMFAKLYQGIKR